MPFVPENCSDSGTVSRGRGWLVDGIVVLAIVVAWYLCLSGPVQEVVPVADDTYRDAACAENILHGRIVEDPSMTGLPYWYAPGGPLLYAAVSKLTGIRPLELYSRSVLWLHVWIPVGFYLVVRWYWDRAVALVALAMVWLCSPWWQTHLMMPMPSIQGLVFILAALALWRPALQRGPGWSVLLGVVLAACTWHHLLSAVIVSGAIGCHALFWTPARPVGRWLAALKRALVAGAVCAVLIFPLAWHLARLPVNNPAPPTYYGSQLDEPPFALQIYTPLLIPAAVVGLVIVARKRRDPAAWVLGYLTVGLVGQASAYAHRYLGLSVPTLLPHEFQWHGQLALGILAAVGIVALARRACRGVSRAPARRLATTVSVLLLVVLVAAPDRLRAFERYDDYWRSAQCDPDVLAAMDWIRQNSAIDDVFVCGYMTGYYEIAGRTGRKLILMPEGRANIAADVRQRRHDLAYLETTKDPEWFLATAVDTYGARFAYLADGDRVLRDRWPTWDIFEAAYRSPQGKRTILRIVDRRRR